MRISHIRFVTIILLSFILLGAPPVLASESLPSESGDVIVQTVDPSGNPLSDQDVPAVIRVDVEWTSDTVILQNHSNRDLEVIAQKTDGSSEIRRLISAVGTSAEEAPEVVCAEARTVSWHTL